ncbi:MAG: glycoside hydrolase family 36 protein [Bacteroidota bacterium]
MNTTLLPTTAPLAIELSSKLEDGWKIETSVLEKEEANFKYRFTLTNDTPAMLKPLRLVWKLPAIGLRGVWKSNSLYNKRFQYDWELEHLQSRVSTDAPVVCAYDHFDQNLITFACSEVVELVEMNALLREEDNHLYCELNLFKEWKWGVDHYTFDLHVDLRKHQFSRALQEVGEWWAGRPDLKPAQVPNLARVPLYSTWYNYHQNLSEEELIKEARLAVSMGLKLMIIDDGWQTKDSNRGYDFTGDWEPERLTDMRGLVADLHAVGMRVALWYSVPFCGKKSKAYQHFRGKFLTEDHRWAPVFDPRYPEVRSYLINKYAKALKEWDLDGFKLDFIDDFKVYPDTPLEQNEEQDYHSVNAAVDRLLTDIYAALSTIKPEVVIEFRQQYIGPAVRKCGNMLRAFDCPGDAVTNRIRTTDVKLLCGTTAVHSDMITWHPEEPVEIAALQVTNILFSVPQISVILREIPLPYQRMITHYNQYWLTNRPILLDGEFIACDPLANYPILQASQGSKSIIGLYSDQVVRVAEPHVEVDIINSKPSMQVFVQYSSGEASYELEVLNCQGEQVMKTTIVLSNQVCCIDVPAAGIIQLRKEEILEKGGPN